MKLKETFNLHDSTPTQYVDRKMEQVQTASNKIE